MPDPDAPTRDDRTPEERARAEARAAAAAEARAAARYVTGEEIARGGMGRVVAATDEVLGRVVAVKEALATDAASLRRFARETRITARLEHPAIVPIYDAGRGPDGTPYYVMRRVSGRPLDALVEAATTLAERLALLPHVMAAADAVAHAHHRGVIHRDLKPANILVGELGETVVIDWGLAKVAGDDPDEPAAPSPAPASAARRDALTRAGAVFGTPGFMAPEQLAGTGVDARGDVYALGATLYFVLAREPPHAGEGEAEALMARAAAGPPAPIAERAPGVPRDLAWIVETALAHAPEDRYADAGALAAELKAFLTGQLVASRDYPARERLARFVRQHRIAVIAVTAAVVALAVGGAVAVSRVLAAQGRTEEALAVALREKQQAADALVEAQLGQARTLLATNPTAAVAAVRPLARTARWREARAIGAAARATGACVGLPGPLQPIRIAVAPGGGRAVSSAHDGSIWVHELAARTSREVARGRPRQARAAFAGDDRLVVYERHALAAIDLATGARRELPHALEVHAAAATPGAAFVVAPGGEVHRVDLDGGGTAALPVAGARFATVSPDGRAVAIETATGLIVVDDRGAPIARFPGGLAVDARWDASSRAISVRLGDELVLAGLWPVPLVVVRRPAAGRIAHVPDAGALAATSAAGLVDAAGAVRLGSALPFSSPIELAHDGALVLGRRGGTITVVTDRVIVELRAPSDELVHVASAPGGRFVVAAVAGRVLVWDLAALLPDAAPVPKVDTIHAALGHRVLLGSGGDNAAWHDLDTGAQLEVAQPLGMFQPVPDPDGAFVVLVPLAQGQPRELAVMAWGRAPSAIAIDATAVAAEGGRVIAGTAAGQVVAIDPVTGARTILTGAAAAVTALGTGGGWLAARWADGRAWRRGPDGREAGGVLVPAAAGGAGLAVGGDGTVCAAAGTAVDCWGAAGGTTTRAVLPAAAAWIGALGTGRALVGLVDQRVARVDLATGAVAVLAAVTGAPIIAPGAELASTIARGRPVVADLAVDAAWPLAASLVRTGTARITPDGALVAVLAGRTLLVWRTALPPTAEATARWLDELTNATVEPGTLALGWR